MLCERWESGMVGRDDAFECNLCGAKCNLFLPSAAELIFFLDNDLD